MPDKVAIDAPSELPAYLRHRGKSAPKKRKTLKWLLDQARRLREECHAFIDQIPAGEDGPTDRENDRLTDLRSMLFVIANVRLTGAMPDVDDRHDAISDLMRLLRPDGYFPRERAIEKVEPEYGIGSQRLTITVDLADIWTGQLVQYMPWLLKQRDFYISGYVAHRFIDVMLAMRGRSRFTPGVLEGEAATIAASRQWPIVPKGKQIDRILEVFRAMHDVHCGECGHTALFHNSGIQCRAVVDTSSGASECGCRVGQRAVIEQSFEVAA